MFISGPVASGKTHLIKRLVDRMPRSLILDAGADYLSNEYEHIWSNPQALATRLEENPNYYRLAYHPNSSFYDEEFHWCYASLWSVDKPRWFVIEEVHEVCGINAIHPDLENILRYSRHNLVGIIGSSQRIADVDKLLTGSARMVILFRTDEFRDIEATRQRWGREMSEALAKLRPCIYNDATKECEQHPECLVYVKGYGFKVIALGDKIKTGESETPWHEQQAEEPSEQAELSSEQNSGQQDSEFAESSSDRSQQH